MICEKCGREKEDNRICICESETNILQYNLANKKLNDIFVSPVTLLIMILLVIGILMSMVASIITTSGNGSVIMENLIICIIVSLPNIVLLIGFYRLYCGGKKNIIPIDTSGLVIISKLLKVMRRLFIVLLVFCVLGLVSMLSVSEEQYINSMNGAYTQYFPEGMIFNSFMYEIMLVAYFIVCVGLFIAIVFMKKMVNTLTNVMNVAMGKATQDISMVLVVASMGIGALMMVSSLSYLGTLNVFSFVSFLLNGSIYICFGIVLFKVRKVINGLRENITV